MPLIASSSAGSRRLSARYAIALEMESCVGAAISREMNRRMTADQQLSSGRAQQIFLAINTLRRNVPGGSNTAIVDAFDTLAQHADAAALAEVEAFLGS